MSVFTPREIQYLESQLLGRLATTGGDRQPHIVPVNFRYNSDMDSIDIGGHEFANRKKYRDVLENPRVAFVVDDLVSTDPWTPRGIEIRGESEVLEVQATPKPPSNPGRFMTSLLTEEGIRVADLIDAPEIAWLTRVIPATE